MARAASTAALAAAAVPITMFDERFLGELEVRNPSTSTKGGM